MPFEVLVVSCIMFLLGVGFLVGYLLGVYRSSVLYDSKIKALINLYASALLTGANFDKQLKFHRSAASLDSRKKKPPRLSMRWIHLLLYKQMITMRKERELLEL